MIERVYLSFYLALAPTQGPSERPVLEIGPSQVVFLLSLDF